MSVSSLSPLAKRVAILTATHNKNKVLLGVFIIFTAILIDETIICFEKLKLESRSMDCIPETLTVNQFNRRLSKTSMNVNYGPSLVSSVAPTKL